MISKVEEMELQPILSVINGETNQSESSDESTEDNQPTKPNVILVTPYLFHTNQAVIFYNNQNVTDEARAAVKSGKYGSPNVTARSTYPFQPFLRWFNETLKPTFREVITGEAISENSHCKIVILVGTIGFSKLLHLEYGTLTNF